MFVEEPVVGVKGKLAAGAYGSMALPAPITSYWGFRTILIQEPRHGRSDLQMIPCQTTLPTTSTMCVVYHTFAHTFVPMPYDFPRGLSHNEEEERPPRQGACLLAFLLYSSTVPLTLYQEYTAIFISPSSAVSESGNKGTVKGNAAKHDVKTTEDSLIYASHHVVYNATGGHGQFNYRQFCKTLKDTITSWPDAECAALLQWWNERVFSESHQQQMAPTRRANGTVSIAERMAQPGVSCSSPRGPQLLVPCQKSTLIPTNVIAHHLY
ncbi:hypothetical protein C8R47DRAFT_1250877 [Mycena vitilis]|nr:hypothetical protein C8R47DRAFT_1250877 [Mycena vitilis]